MDSRRQRLGKLVGLQRQVKALHETRNARHRAAAIAAAADAEAIAARSDAADSLSDLFPDLYQRYIARARDAQALETARAAEQAALATAADLRADIVRRAYRDAMRQDERAAEERDILELVERLAAKHR